MGTVHLGEVAEATVGLEPGRKVAVKIVHPHLLSSPGFFKRFLREAELGGKVVHENVVRTFDVDATHLEGRVAHYLVMEYVEGRTIRALLRELDRVPEELCRHIGRAVSRALRAIHDAGVVHRDLKPENLLITKDHEVKVMDLGVARLQDQSMKISQAGGFIGSVLYAAPEQFRSEEPDFRADLYALGLILYELSTGKLPGQADDFAAVMQARLGQEPRPVSELNPQLSPFFEEVVKALLTREPDDRLVNVQATLEQGEEGDWWRERAKSIRETTRRPLRRIRIPRETALYGRDDDLSVLQELYEKAKSGDGQVVLLEGEAGIGKTRLVDEFVGRLRQEGEDLNFLFGSYPPGGAATAAGAFSTAYREHFGEEAIEETLEDYLTVSPLLIPAFSALLRGDAPPTGAEQLNKDSLQTVFVHATRKLAAERPTVVLIDDLHYAPEEGRGVFAALALAVADHRVLLVGTHRRGVADDWLASVERPHHATRRELMRLGPKDLGRLLVDAFQSERLAEELSLKIATRSDGNPFFVFEIIRGLREGRFITRKEDGTWVRSQVIGRIEIPSSVLDLIQARIADLDSQERNLLDIASCCGFEFDPILVGEALGLQRIPLLQSLGVIEMRHRLVRSAGLRYVFDHHQILMSSITTRFGRRSTRDCPNCFGASTTPRWARRSRNSMALRTRIRKTSPAPRRWSSATTFCAAIAATRPCAIWRSLSTICRRGIRTSSRPSSPTGRSRSRISSTASRGWRSCCARRAAWTRSGAGPSRGPHSTRLWPWPCRRRIPSSRRVPGWDSAAFCARSRSTVRRRRCSPRCWRMPGPPGPGARSRRRRGSSGRPATGSAGTRRRASTSSAPAS
jgi:hypothetical protein